MLKLCAVLAVRWNLALSCSAPPRMWIIPLSSTATLYRAPAHQSLSSPLGYQVNCRGIAVLGHPYFTWWPWHARLPGRSCNASLSEKVNVLSLIRYFIVLPYHKSSEGWLQYNKIFEEDHIHIAFIIVYCCNCSFIIVVYLSLCLIYKLNFITGMYM